jgi:hypothetical protein
MTVIEPRNMIWVEEDVRDVTEKFWLENLKGRTIGRFKIRW